MANAQTITVTWYAVSISVDQNAVTVGTNVTVSVSTNPDPAGTGLTAVIVVDGTQVSACSGGDPCSHQFSSSSAATHSFTAYVADAAGNPVAKSQTLNVAWQGGTSTWTITLSLANDNPPSGTADLTATLNQDWTSSGYVLKLQRDNANGYVLDTCSPQFHWGCTFSVSQQLGPGEPPGSQPNDTRTYVVTLNPQGTVGSPVATSNAVSISWGSGQSRVSARLIAGRKTSKRIH